MVDYMGFVNGGTERSKFSMRRRSAKEPDGAITNVLVPARRVESGGPPGL